MLGLSICNVRHVSPFFSLVVSIAHDGIKYMIDDTDTSIRELELSVQRARMKEPLFNLANAKGGRKYSKIK